MSHVGGRIRSIRLRQQRTLRDVASRCDFTVSLLSKIEAGKTSPPIATISKIAAALGVGLAQLFSTDSAEATAFTPATSLVAQLQVQTDKGYAFHLLAAGRSSKAMQPFLFVAERGQVNPGTMTHRGEEFIYVLSGRMRYRVGATTYTLGPGDSLYFSSTEAHDLEPVTQVVKFIALFMSDPPVVATARPRQSAQKPAKVRS